MLNIEPRHLAIVQDILKNYPYDFYVFGSRVTSAAKTLSDLDLGYFAKITPKELLELEDDFEESDLPYKVDIIDLSSCNAEFLAIIKKDMIPFPKSL